MKAPSLAIAPLLGVFLCCTTADTGTSTVGLPLRERARIRGELNLKRVDQLLLPAISQASSRCTFAVPPRLVRLTPTLSLLHG